VPTLREIYFEFLAWLIVAFFCGVAAWTIWIWAKRSGRKLLQPRRDKPVPWTGLEIGAAFFLTRLFWQNLVAIGLIDLGFFPWLYGWERPIDLESMDPIAKGQMNLWLTLTIFPLNIATIVFIFRLGSGTQIKELGLSICRPRENLCLACLHWLAITPLVFGVGFLASLVYFALMGSKPESHPLEQLAEQSPTMLNGVLIGLSALVAAPVFEELMFRGVLQPWLAQRDWGGHLGMGVAGIIALATVISSFHDHGELTLPLMVGKLSPILFVLAMVPVYLYVDRVLRRWIPDRNGVRGIFATALIFGMVHSPIWPTPIPLFVLGLAMGFLAYRTQTLLAPILLHTLFNAVACLTLILPHVLPDLPKGSEETSAFTRSAPTATSTRVPGSWQLRCK
jgi:membrane protease YdiL (CAAX protease family)